MSAATIDPIRAAASIQADRRSAFDQLVRDLSNDAEVAATEVLAITEDAGETLDTLQAAVDLRVKRMLAREALDGLADAERDQAAAEQDRQRLERERTAGLTKLKAEHDAAVALFNRQLDVRLVPVNERLAEAQQRVGDADDGAGILRQTASAALRDRLADLRSRLVTANATLNAESPTLKARLVEIDRLLMGGVPPERDEATHPFRGSVLEIQRARRGEQTSRAARIKQLETLTREREQIEARLYQIQYAPAALAEQIREAEGEMLVV